MKSSKRVSLSVLVLLALLLTGFTWSYWNAGKINAATTNQGQTIVLGAAKNSEITTTIEGVEVGKGSSTGELVPAGRKSVSGEKAVESINQTFSAQWKEKDSNLAKGHNGVLTATIKNIRFENGAQGINAADFVKVSTLTQTVDVQLNGGAVETPAFVFTLVEPQSKVQYDAINSKKILFDVDFKIEPKQ